MTDGDDAAIVIGGAALDVADPRWALSPRRGRRGPSSWKLSSRAGLAASVGEEALPPSPFGIGGGGGGIDPKGRDLMNETINRRTPSSGGPPAALLVEGTAQPSQVQAAAPSDEASLRARKEALLADLDRLAKVSSGVREAYDALEAIRAAEAELDAAERSAWDLWAQKGPSPSPRREERAELARRRVLADADLAGALRAEKAVAPRQAALVRELKDITDLLFAIEVERLVAEAAGFEEKMREAERALVAAAVEIDGRRDALYEARVQATQAGNEGRVVTLTAAIDKVQAIKPPGEVLADPLVRARLAAAAQRRLTG